LALSRRRKIANTPTAVSNPSPTSRPALDVAGAGADTFVQMLSTQVSPVSHCAVTVHEPPLGTGVLVGVEVGVTSAVDVTVAVAVTLAVEVTLGVWVIVPVAVGEATPAQAPSQNPPSPGWL
jgi:hypothetical protein